MHIYCTPLGTPRERKKEKEGCGLLGVCSSPRTTGGKAQPRERLLIIKILHLNSGKVKGDEKKRKETERKKEEKGKGEMRAGFAQPRGYPRLLHLMHHLMVSVLGWPNNTALAQIPANLITAGCVGHVASRSTFRQQVDGPPESVHLRRGIQHLLCECVCLCVRVIGGKSVYLSSCVSVCLCVCGSVCLSVSRCATLYQTGWEPILVL